MCISPGPGRGRKTLPKDNKSEIGTHGAFQSEFLPPEWSQKPLTENSI